MRRRLLPLPLLVAALVAGCGASTSSSTDFEGEEKAVADQVEKIQSAGEARDARQLCDEVLAKDLRDAIAAAGSSCEVELDKAIRDADDFALEVEDVTITGTTATATVRTGSGSDEQTRDFEFERDGTSWRATSLGGA
jgi:dihydroxyacetone kinase